MSYPNLHAQVSLDEAYDIAPGRIRPKISVRFGPKIVAKNMRHTTYQISAIDSGMVKDLKESLRPAIGDEVIEINDRSIRDWSNENFTFCKFPLREQCEANFFDSFRKAFLSWNWTQPLKYRLRRNGREWIVDIPYEPATQSTSTALSTESSVSECPSKPDGYRGFKVAYVGTNICAFEPIDSSSAIVLRIASFAYREIPKESKIQSVTDEVDHFYEKYWKEKQSRSKKLIIDVSENGGGDTPVDWYMIFFSKSFQEEFVQFKKLPEIDDPAIRRDLFYDDAGKEIWFSDLVKSGLYKRLNYGDFLPPVPQFCVTQKESCSKGLFPARGEGFKGDIAIIVNEWCISSCTGFVWKMKDYFGRRLKVVGIPNSGDSAYARLFLDVFLDSSKPNGFRTEVSSRVGRTRQKLPVGAIIREQVTATRSTDANGKILSATPTAIDVWVPYQFPDFGESWDARALEAALKATR
ncbi:MAG: hypothetical protein EOP06_16835 [Proteobacteria bacterium]|nr:MAG: hypothetical protein EOP06_16835 [Pseudomonadota bacterium]